MLTVTNMAAERNLWVMFSKLNVVEISISENYVQKWINKLCNY